MEQTSNVFNKGLQMDTHPMVQGNDTLSDALNATFVTMNGNEIILLNDMGNRKIDNAYLPSGYLPVGMKEYGGIIYVAAYNPITNLSLIGSFPSPERRVGEEVDDLGGELYLNIVENSSNELGSFTYTEKDGIKFLDNDTVMISLTSDTSLHTGDKFTVYSDYIWDKKPNISNFDNIDAESGKIYSPKNKLYTLLLGVLNSQNNFVDITESLLRWETKEIINEESEETIYKSEIVDFANNVSDLVKFNTGYFIAKNFNIPTTEESDTAKLISERQKLAVNTYAYKLVGPLYLKATLNHISSFNYTITGSKTENNIVLYINSTITYNCPDGVLTKTGSNDIYKTFDEGETSFKWFDFYIKNTNSTYDNIILREIKHKIKDYVKKLSGEESDIAYSLRIKTLLKFKEYPRRLGETELQYWDRIDTTEESYLTAVAKYKNDFPQFTSEEEETDLQYEERIDKILNIWDTKDTFTLERTIIEAIERAITGNITFIPDPIFITKYNELTNTYIVQVKKQYTIDLSGTDTIDYYICPIIYNLDVNELHLLEYSLKGTINLNLLGSGVVELKAWKFENNDNGYNLTYNFDSYIENEQHSFENLRFHFLDVSKEMNITSPEGELSNGMQNNGWISIDVEEFNGSINITNKLEENVLYRVLITYDDVDEEDNSVTRCINFWELYLTTPLLNSYNETYNDFRLIGQVTISPSVEIIPEKSISKSEGDLIGRYYSATMPTDGTFHMYKDVKNTIKITSNEIINYHPELYPTWLKFDYEINNKTITFNTNSATSEFTYKVKNNNEETEWTDNQTDISYTQSDDILTLDYKYKFDIASSQEEQNIDVNNLFISLKDYLVKKSTNKIFDKFFSKVQVLYDALGDTMAMEHTTQILDNKIKPRTSTGENTTNFLPQDGKRRFIKIMDSWEQFETFLNEAARISLDQTYPSGARFVFGCTHDKSNYYYCSNRLSSNVGADIPNTYSNPYYNAESRPIYCWMNYNFGEGTNKWALFSVMQGLGDDGVPVSDVILDVTQKLDNYNYYYTFNSTNSTNLVEVYFKNTDQYLYLYLYEIQIPYTILVELNSTLESKSINGEDLLKFNLSENVSSTYEINNDIIISSPSDFTFADDCVNIINTTTIESWCQDFEENSSSIINLLPLEKNYMYAIKSVGPNTNKIIKIKTRGEIPVNQNSNENYFIPSVTYTDIWSMPGTRYLYDGLVIENKCDYKAPRQLEYHIYQYSQSTNRPSQLTRINYNYNYYKLQLNTDVLSYYTVPALTYSEDL